MRTLGLDTAGQDLAELSSEALLGLAERSVTRRREAEIDDLRTLAAWAKVHSTAPRHDPDTQDVRAGLPGVDGPQGRPHVATAARRPDGHRRRRGGPGDRWRGTRSGDRHLRGEGDRGRPRDPRRAGA
jgi:hypothetical protein